ncbi:MAG: hypothetical protein WBF90_19050 [Rivularia sp. (in: cyanobacteria)]
MNYKTFFASLFIFSITFSPVQACPTGNPKSTNYIRRDNNRCEGDRNKIPTSGSLKLISFTTAKPFANFNSLLNLIIPYNSAKKPNLKVLSSDKLSYQMDNVTLTPNASGFIFNWSTYVLKKLNLSPKSLRILASFQEGSQITYTPVIIEKSSDIYEFVWYYNNKVQAFFSIYNNEGKVISNSKLPKHSNGKKEVVLIWDGRKFPPGKYKLHYSATLYEPNEPMSDTGTIVFTHNPNWLK